MKPFVEFFLEYRHKTAEGLKNLNHAQASNKKGANLAIDPTSRKHAFTKGPYKKQYEDGDVIFGSQLEKELMSLNGVPFEPGKSVRRKNTSPAQELHMFINAHGQKAAKVMTVK